VKILKSLRNGYVLTGLLG